MKRIIVTTLIALPLLFMSASSSAHPLGSRMFGHRMIATLAPEQIKLTYIAEIPTSKLVLMMERFKRTHGLKRLGPEEERAFNRDMLKHLQSNLKLTVDGRKRELRIDPNYAPSQGTGDYRFFEYRLYLVAGLSDLTPKSFPFVIRNENFRKQRAVFHNEIKHLPGAYATDANIPEVMGWIENPSYRLFSATFNRGETPAGQVGDEPATAMFVGEGTQLLDILRAHELTVDVVLLAFLTALFLGAVHALSPGHGKALVAAYLVGTRGTIGHAVYLGVIVTITHVLSVVILGVASLIAAQYVVPEYYMPFVSLAAGLMIVGIGVRLIIKRIGGKGVGAEHDHLHPHPSAGTPVSLRTITAFGVTGGIMPCPSAMVVMLTAIAIGRITFGLALIFFFSIGLSVVLTIIGIVAIKARGVLERFSSGSLFTRWLPLVSAVVITILGMAIVYKGFWVEWMMWK